MPATFMAVAIDLGDPSSPYGSIHPRDKQDVARRLVAGSLSVAYDRPVHFQGPVPTKAVIRNLTVVLTYRSFGNLKVSEKENFEVNVFGRVDIVLLFTKLVFVIKLRVGYYLAKPLCRSRFDASLFETSRKV